ncbi:hypothetical protein [Methylogaea oryzae]|uniref:hypothetical protein n=1 Tax=Methylogaea oryzae TaxID=1295382 RepID=UPI0006CF84BF|nr:hypothetical protein [Methylogaea oryzae]
MAALKDALAAELEKTRSVEERQRAETLQRLEESAVAQAPASARSCWSASPGRTCTVGCWSC